MRILVVLGRRLNDDGSMHADLIRRCDRAIRFLGEEGADRVLLSGGMPNHKALRAEAEAMKEYLLNFKVSAEIIILETESKTTRQNARFSAPIIKNLKADTVYICSSRAHLIRPYLNPIRLFRRALGKDYKIIPVSV